MQAVFGAELGIAPWGWGLAPRSRLEEGMTEWGGDPELGRWWVKS